MPLKISQTILYVFLLLLFILPISAQEESEPRLPVTILVIEGHVEYRRPGFTESQVLLPGSQLWPTDIIFPNEASQASLLVLCPEGNVRRFLSMELVGNSYLRCDSSDEPFVPGQAGTRRALSQRTNDQMATYPYVIYPRATLVRDPHITLIWNPVFDASFYDITVSDAQQATIEPLRVFPVDVHKNDRAEMVIRLPSPGEPYDIQVCAFVGLDEYCGDGKNSENAQTAIYYMPAPWFEEVESNLRSSLPDNGAAYELSLAVLLSQPVDAAFEVDGPDAYYGEAIQHLEALLDSYPENELARSPEVYDLLGKLYAIVGLTPNALNAFQQSLDLAEPSTEIAARAAFNAAEASVAPDDLDYYLMAMSRYNELLSDEAFAEFIEDFCETRSGICMDPAFEDFVLQNTIRN